MNVKTKRYLLFISLLTISQFLFSNFLYEITDGKFRAKTAPKIHFLKDGNHYTSLEDNSFIVKYNCRTAQATDTVFNLSKIGVDSIARISGYEFSPDEKTIMIQTKVESRYRRSYTANYYTYDIRRNRLRSLSEYGKQEVPLFSPDSRYVAFVRENNLFLRKLDFNTEVQVTKDGKEGAIINGHADWVYEEEFGQTRYFEWSPDSKKIAFLKFDEREVPEFSFQLYSKNKSIEQNLYPYEVKFKYPKAGEKNSKVKVYIYDDFNKSCLEVPFEKEDQDFYIPRIRWTNDQTGQLAVFRLNRDQNQLKTFFVNAKSVVPRLILSEENEHYIDYETIDDIHFTKDNKSFFYLSDRNGFRHIYKYSINGILEKQLTSGNWDVISVYGYDENTKTLYYQSSELSPLQTSLYSLNTKGVKKLLSKAGGTHKISFNDDFSLFLDNQSSIEMPNKVSIRTSKGEELSILEDNKALLESLDALNLPKKEFFSFTTSENVKLNGWILKPKHLDKKKKHPLLLVQYSGPNSQLVRDQWRVDWEYYLAENGYVVACVDGRGTGNRGAEFLKCTYRQLGHLETKDQIETAKYLGGKNFIDKERIGIWGWSFGGFTVLNALSSDENVFKVGIAVAPVTDWRLYDSAYTERYMRRPKENFDGYELTSPLMNAEKMNAKLLIIHGTADDNVHIQNTFLYVDQLVKANKQFEMQIYTDKDHSISGKTTRRHLYRRKCNFLFNNL